ncbi:putative copper-binding chaperone; signal peptide [Blastococcus saxobsidens DD2]|uniref:Putative copper-binding chaperone signal peptide n=1 Tax=Blastococcus saxobsidens (strain DD2) TaxID=1146883 RepID=H6RQ63_BLASD|nr:putative copper-binding chaperone; signal peptide [Blastococcus saxobsidens DD2]
MRVVRGRTAASAAVLLGSLMLAGCGADATDPVDASAENGITITTEDDGFHGTVMDPPRPRPNLELLTTSGEVFDLSERPDDEVTVLFFGYTHCPDLCPTTMADLSLAREMLEPELQDHVQVLFVTEDPARDTPAALREWLDRFDPEFTGLIGGSEATAAALTELYLPETAQVPAASDAPAHPHDGDDAHQEYGIDHAGAVYIWGPGDRSIVYTGGTTPEQYAEDLTELAAAG